MTRTLIFREDVRNVVLSWAEEAMTCSICFHPVVTGRLVPLLIQMGRPVCEILRAIQFWIPNLVLLSHQVWRSNASVS